MFKRFVKTLIVSVFLLFSTSSVFAIEEYISRIYKELDKVFILKSDDELNQILSANNKDKYYYLIENYTEKKIRRLIVNNDYDFAMTAIIIVIENNLDNEQAVEMYAVISDVYEIQQQHEIEKEEKRKLELARIELEKEKKRGDAEKEYVYSAKAEGGSVFVSKKEEKLTSSFWKADLGIGNIQYLFDKGGEVNSVHIGIAADYSYEYTLENKMVIGGDIFGAAQFLGLAPEEKLASLLVDVEGAAKVSFPVVENLFVRAGFGILMAGRSDKAVDVKNINEKFFTPVVGVRWERVPVSSLRLDVGAEWLAGHLFYDNIKFAMGAEANVEVPFADLDKIKLSLNVGLRDRLFVKNSGLENRASLILAIGAENVIK